MSRVISVRLPDEDASKLERLARLFRRSLGETARLLLDEKLKEEEFAFIEFRNSSIGRLPYVKGTGVAVWEVVMVARSHDDDVERVASHLGWRVEPVAAALAYAESDPDQLALADEAHEVTSVELQRRVPGLRTVLVGGTEHRGRPGR